MSWRSPLKLLLPHFRDVFRLVLPAANFRGGSCTGTEDAR
jgi:hypothetical protein